MWNPSNPTRRTSAFLTVFVLPVLVWWLVFAIDWPLVIRAFFKFPERPGGNWIWVGLVIVMFLAGAGQKFWKLQSTLGWRKSFWPSVRTGLFLGFIGFLFLFTVSLIIEVSQTKKNYASIDTPCEMAREAAERGKWKKTKESKIRDACKAPDAFNGRDRTLPKSESAKGRPVEPKDDNRELVKQTREIAKKARGIHDQLESDLKDVKRDTEWDVEHSRMDMQGEERDRHDEMVRRAHLPEEMRVRKNAENQYIKCCEKAALTLREELMLKCPDISNQESLRDFSGEYDDGYKVKRNLGSYSTIANVLDSLANALENGNCRYK